MSPSEQTRSRKSRLGTHIFTRTAPGAAALPNGGPAKTPAMKTKCWAAGPLAALDLEATGPDPDNDRIVELALVVADPVNSRPARSARLDPVECIVRPDIPVSAAALRVHGLRDHDCQTRGVAPHAALTRAAGCLFEIARQGIPLVMFNARYDWTLLAREAARHRVRMPSGVRLLDAMLLFDQVAPAARPARSLHAAARTYGVSNARPHRAADDAVATAEVVREIARGHAWIGSTPVDRLQTLQASWHESWRERFNKRRAAHGGRESVQAGWPTVRT